MTNTLRAALAFAFTLMLGAGQTALAEHTESPAPPDVSGPVSGTGSGALLKAGCEVGDYLTIGADARGRLHLQCSHFPGGTCGENQVVIFHHHDGPGCVELSPDAFAPQEPQS